MRARTISPSSISRPVRRQPLPSATRHARSSSSEPRQVPGRECRMTTYHKQIGSNSLRRLTMVGGLVISVFVLGVGTQIVQSVFAAAAGAAKGGDKVSIRTFAVSPGGKNNTHRTNATGTKENGR